MPDTTTTNAQIQRYMTNRDGLFPSRGSALGDQAKALRDLLCQKRLPFTLLLGFDAAQLVLLRDEIAWHLDQLDRHLARGGDA
jgi:hypothetical protein